jgi:hypothetical protein
MEEYCWVYHVGRRIMLSIFTCSSCLQPNSTWDFPGLGTAKWQGYQPVVHWHDPASSSLLELTWKANSFCTWRLGHVWGFHWWTAICLPLVPGNRDLKPSSSDHLGLSENLVEIQIHDSWQRIMFHLETVILWGHCRPMPHFHSLKTTAMSGASACLVQWCVPVWRCQKEPAAKGASFSRIWKDNVSIWVWVNTYRYHF